MHHRGELRRICSRPAVSPARIADPLRLPRSPGRPIHRVSLTAAVSVPCCASPSSSPGSVPPSWGAVPLPFPCPGATRPQSPNRGSATSATSDPDQFAARRYLRCREACRRRRRRLREAAMVQHWLGGDGVSLQGASRRQRERGACRRGRRRAAMAHDRLGSGLHRRARLDGDGADRADSL